MVERVPLLPARWLWHLQYFGKFGVGKGWPLARADDTAFGRIQSACASLQLHAVRTTGAGIMTEPPAGLVTLLVYDLECSEPRIALDVVQQFQLH